MNSETSDIVYGTIVLALTLASIAGLCCAFQKLHEDDAVDVAATKIH